MYIQPFPQLYVNVFPLMLIVFSLFERKKSRVGPSPRPTDCRAAHTVLAARGVLGGAFQFPQHWQAMGGTFAAASSWVSCQCWGGRGLWMLAGGYGVAGEEIWPVAATGSEPRV